MFPYTKPLGSCFVALFGGRISVMDPDFMDPKLLPKKANLGHLNTYINSMKSEPIASQKEVFGSGMNKFHFFPKIRAVFLASDAALHWIKSFVSKKKRRDITNNHGDVMGGIFTGCNFYMYNQHIFWLVVGPPLRKIWVRQLGWWQQPNICKNKKCSKPPTGYFGSSKTWGIANPPQYIAILIAWRHCSYCGNGIMVPGAYFQASSLTSWSPLVNRVL